ncbi:porin family protein [Maribacter halichondriae]|uniref:porin family protein n=1 Tax=Maribacter halichondriae TaxID=2980554 RepID=UPI0023590D13|nr:porin family protein [Maribacter sp. Hal144]
MKNKLYLLTALFLFTLSAGAQDDIRFGAKVGFNAANLSGDAIYSYDVKPGFHLGGALEIPVSDAFMVQPEALISLQGSGGFFQDDLNFWYLNVPVMAKYNIFDGFYIEAGPQIGLLFADNLEGNAFAGAPTVSQSSNGFDIGLGIGAGYRLDENFYFQLRFNAGIVNAIEDISSKNRVFQISAIYFL